MSTESRKRPVDPTDQEGRVEAPEPETKRQAVDTASFVDESKWRTWIRQQKDNTSIERLVSQLNSDDLNEVDEGLAALRIVSEKTLERKAEYESLAAEQADLKKDFERTNLLFQYLTLSPECIELTSLWKDARYRMKGTKVLASLLRTLNAVITSNFFPALRHVSYFLCKMLSQTESLKLVYSVFSQENDTTTIDTEVVARMERSQQKSISVTQIIALLQLLTTIVQKSNVAARELLRDFNFNFRPLASLINMRRKKVALHSSFANVARGTKQLWQRDIRTYYVRWVLSFLSYPDEPDICIQTVQTPRLLPSIFATFSSDPPTLMMEVLEKLRVSVLENRFIPRKAKVSFFSKYFLDTVTNVMNRSNPHAYDDISVAAEEPLQDAFYKITYDICFSPSDGLAFPDPDWNSERNPEAPSKNGSLQKLMAQLKPNQKPLHRFLFFELIKSLPDLFYPYARQITITFEPRLSLYWFHNISFLSDLHRFTPIPPFPASSPLPPADPAFYLHHVLIPIISSTHLNQAILHKSQLVQLQAASFMILFLEKISTTISSIRSHYQKLSNDVASKWEDFIDTILHKVIKALPNITTVITSYNNLSSQAISSLDLALGPAHDTSKFVLAERILTLIEWYSALLPQTIVSMNYDLINLVPSTVSLNRMPVIMQYRLQSLLFYSHTSFIKTDITSSKLQTFLECLVSTTNKDVYNISLQLITKILIHMDLFSNSKEIECWLCALDSPTSVLCFLGILQVAIQNRFQMIDIVSGLRATLSTFLPASAIQPVLGLPESSSFVLPFDGKLLSVALIAAFRAFKPPKKADSKVPFVPLVSRYVLQVIVQLLSNTPIGTIPLLLAIDQFNQRGRTPGQPLQSLDVHAFDSKDYYFQAIIELLLQQTPKSLPSTHSDGLTLVPKKNSYLDEPNNLESLCSNVLSVLEARTPSLISNEWPVVIENTSSLFPVFSIPQPKIVDVALQSEMIVAVLGTGKEDASETWSLYQRLRVDLKLQLLPRFMSIVQRAFAAEGNAQSAQLKLFGDVLSFANNEQEITALLQIFSNLINANCWHFLILLAQEKNSKSEDKAKNDEREKERINNTVQLAQITNATKLLFEILIKLVIPRLALTKNLHLLFHFLSSFFETSSDNCHSICEALLFSRHTVNVALQPFSIVLSCNLYEIFKQLNGHSQDGELTLLTPPQNLLFETFVALATRTFLSFPTLTDAQGWIYHSLVDDILRNLGFFCPPDLVTKIIHRLANESDRLDDARFSKALSMVINSSFRPRHQALNGTWTDSQSHLKTKAFSKLNDDFLKGTEHYESLKDKRLRLSPANLSSLFDLLRVRKCFSTLTIYFVHLVRWDMSASDASDENDLKTFTSSLNTLNVELLDCVRGPSPSRDLINALAASIETSTSSLLNRKKIIDLLKSASSSLSSYDSFLVWLPLVTAILKDISSSDHEKIELSSDFFPASKVVSILEQQQKSSSKQVEKISEFILLLIKADSSAASKELLQKLLVLTSPIASEQILLFNLTKSLFSSAPSLLLLRTKSGETLGLVFLYTIIKQLILLCFQSKKEPSVLASILSINEIVLSLISLISSNADASSPATISEARWNIITDFFKIILKRFGFKQVILITSFHKLLSLLSLVSGSPAQPPKAIESLYEITISHSAFLPTIVFEDLDRLSRARQIVQQSEDAAEGDLSAIASSSLLSASETFVEEDDTVVQRLDQRTELVHLLKVLLQHFKNPNKDEAEEKSKDKKKKKDKKKDKKKKKKSIKQEDDDEDDDDDDEEENTKMTITSSFGKEGAIKIQRILLASYNATLAKDDRLLLSVLMWLETEWKCSVGSGGLLSYLWGSHAAKALRGHTPTAALVRQTVSDALIFEQSKLVHSAAEFPVYLDLDSLSSEGADEKRNLAIESHLKQTARSTRDRSLYDPSFVLPYLLHSLKFFEVNCKKFVEVGLINYAISATSSVHFNVRKLAYECLALFFRCVEKAATFRERIPIMNVLRILKNSVTSEYQALPSIISNFVAAALQLQLHPDHVMYLTVNRVVFHSPFLATNQVPLFQETFSTPQTSDILFRQQKWLLNLISHSFKQPKDFVCYSNVHSLQQLLCYYDSSLSSTSIHDSVFHILVRLSAMKHLTRDLIEEFGILCWIHQNIHHTELTKSFLTMLTHFVQNVPIDPTKPHSAFALEISILSQAFATIAFESKGEQWMSWFGDLVQLVKEICEKAKGQREGLIPPEAVKKLGKLVTLYSASPRNSASSKTAVASAFARSLSLVVPPSLFTLDLSPSDQIEFLQIVIDSVLSHSLESSSSTTSSLPTDLISWIKGSLSASPAPVLPCALRWNLFHLSPSVYSAFGLRPNFPIV